MKKIFLKVLVCLLAALMMFSVNAFAIEEEQSSVTPRWVSIFDIDLTMGFDGDIGNVTGSASKMSTASMIEGTLYLYEKINGQWVYVDEGYKSKTVGGIGISIDFDAVSGREYKAEFVVTAYTDGVGETETVYNYKTCP
ncbi:MAG: hypothetical protein IJW79_12535 [Clostridia bacterium]|nr:hypothetical protein [Clostridia bacterium]